MERIGDLPQLQIVNVANLILHEYHDPQRTPPLIGKLESSGVLRNPPMVVPMQRQAGHFMVLDGANRVSAFRDMGIPHLLVQIIDPEVDQVNLNSWNHVIWGIQSEELFDLILTLPDVNLEPRKRPQSFQDLMDVHLLAAVCLPGGKFFAALTQKAYLLDRIKILNSIVQSYCEIASIDRIIIDDVDTICDHYEDLAGLVIMPTFSLAELLTVVESGHLMPPGITRFTIAPRALHVNFLLEELAEDGCIEEKNFELNRYLRSCLAAKRVRFYAEPTVLFDE